MCLYKKHHYPKIAWKPIVVYKELLFRSKDEIVTPYQITSVSLNTTLKAKESWFKGLISSMKVGWIGSQGVHAYLPSSTKLSIKIMGSVIGVCLKKVNGYTLAELIELPIVVKAIIPRFSLYWLDKNGEDIASSRLFITNELIKGAKALSLENQSLFKMN